MFGVLLAELDLRNLACLGLDSVDNVYRVPY